MNKLQLIVRALLTCMMCYYVFKEAGIITAISIGLIAVTLEINAMWMTAIKESIERYLTNSQKVD